MASVTYAQESDKNRYYHFQASKIDSDAWAWGNAKASKADDLLVVKEANPKGDSGSIHTADRLPFSKDGMVRLHVAEVSSGHYSLQVMAFKKQTYVGEVSLAKDSTNTDEQVFELSDAKVPEGTDEIGFKFWVAGSKSPVSHIKELAYWQKTDDDDKEQLLKTDASASDRWGAEDISLEKTDLGIKATLAKDKNFGATFCKDQARHDAESKVIVELGPTVQCQVKVQGIAFDKAGKVLGEVTVAKNLSVGRHEIETQSLEWPADTHVVTFKLWLEGEKNASTVIRGLKVLK